MVIITDSREQLAYRFENPSEVAALACGDYSIKNLEDCISVERKSLDDLISCLSNDRDRFERELFKGRALDYLCLVIEATLEDIAMHKYRSEMLPKAAIQSLVAFSVRYRLPIWFAGTREYAQRLTESILLKYGREIQKRMEAIKKANG